MQYESKESAEKAAEEFALEKMRDAYYVRHIPVSNGVLVGYHKVPGNKERFERFDYTDLKRGDVCVVKCRIGDYLSVFTGSYSDGNPLFTSNLTLAAGVRRKFVRKTGYNVITGKLNGAQAEPVDYVNTDYDDVRDPPGLPKCDQKVLVKNLLGQKWKERFATGSFASDGRILCWERGLTSEDVSEEISWDLYMIAEDTD